MIRIFKTSLSSSSDSPELLTAELGQQTSPGRRGFGPKSSGHRSPGGGASILANKRLTLPFLALVAVLAAGLLFLLPGGLLQAQSADPIEHPENSADPVLTFTAEDPEGRTIYWSLLDDHQLNGAAIVVGGTDLTESDVVDHEEFTISSDGVLSFKVPPDFEMPVSGIASTESLAARNVYKVVAMASDDAPGASGNMAYHKVTVQVTDMYEDGSISFSAQQPQVMVALTATLKDQDSTATQITEAKWKWYHCPAVGTTCPVIPGETTPTYTPGAVIVGRDLLAVATYKDASGSKEVEARAANAVRAVPSGRNSAPLFPSSASSRSVDENSPPGTPVGAPVAAGDAGDILTYSLSGNDDDALYGIDAATGQITVGSRTMLDRELENFDGDHTVTVQAIDPHADPNATSGEAEVGTGNSHTITVTITVKDLNEAPRITGGPTMTEQAENLKSTPTPDAAEVIVTTYMATDPESAETDLICSECTWSVSGPDSALFDRMKSGAGSDTVARLTFKKAPNFEKPADANMDNVYMVTVVVTDPGMSTDRAIGVGKMTAMRDVAITVTNAQEEGNIKFSSNQPKQGVEFIAALTDDDGPTTVTEWQWEKDTANTPATNCEIVNNADWGPAEGKGAKTDTYTPEAADLDRCLRVTLTYTDPLGDSDVTENVSANPVVADLENKAPQFKDANNKVITSTTRSVAEDAVTDDTPTPEVDVVVSATDGTDTLTYTLGGTDARYFEITDANSSTGQITVKEDTKLDYETKNSYMVTVTATDPSLASTTIDVTINVTDVNEGPEFTAPKEGDVDVTVKENTRSLNIYSFRATDPEGRTVYWSLGTTGSPDTSSFTISDRGALSLKASPDYEDNTGLGSDKTYTVVVVASDDAPGAGITAGDEDPVRDSMKTVTVTVEDVEEPGVITTSPKNPHVDVPVTATLTDGDGDPSSITWEWTVSNGEPAGTGVSSRSYTPHEDDVSKTLRVKATYEEDDEDVEVGPTSAGRIVVAPTPANVGPVFDPNTANRRVDENARADTRLGNAVQATDENDRTLVYTVDDTANFSVSSSGQLSTAAMLNHEGAGNDERTVVVTATDPWGLSADLTYTVTVRDVNEAPTIDTGPTRRDREENQTDTDLQVFTYVASDIDADDDAALTWSIEGEDIAKFDIGEDTGTLAFKESPDYEMPADRNKDNVYKVTVVVSDDGSPKLTDKRQVEVTVTDLEEDGKVTLSSVQPKVAIPLMAALEDSDGDVKDTAWQWYRSDTCPATALTDVN